MIFIKIFLNKLVSKQNFWIIISHHAFIFNSVNIKLESNESSTCLLSKHYSIFTLRHTVSEVDMTFANLPFSHISTSIRWLKFTVVKFLGHDSFIYFLPNSNIFSRFRVISKIKRSVFFGRIYITLDIGFNKTFYLPIYR